MEKTLLIEAAENSRNFAYAPYSHFAVGAALLTKSGRIFTGVNIENVAYSPTNCAERTAFFKAISEGECNFSAIAIVGGIAGQEPVDYCTPCGVCRQVMAEFCRGDFRILCAKNTEDVREYSLSELLPESFGKTSLQ
ncbi:MAG: cytidine deaminase [Oscillospiraceae bacterium]